MPIRYRKKSVEQRHEEAHQQPGDGRHRGPRGYRRGSPVAVRRHREQDNRAGRRTAARQGGPGVRRRLRPRAAARRVCRLRDARRRLPGRDVHLAGARPDAPRDQGRQRRRGRAGRLRCIGRPDVATQGRGHGGGCGKNGRNGGQWHRTRRPWLTGQVERQVELRVVERGSGTLSRGSLLHRLSLAHAAQE